MYLEAYEQHEMWREYYIVALKEKLRLGASETDACVSAKIVAGMATAAEFEHLALVGVKTKLDA